MAVDWKREVVVETFSFSGDIMVFGIPDKDGWRDIEGGGYPFKRGRIMGRGTNILGKPVSRGTPTVGQGIAIETKEHGPKYPWISREVKAIRQA